MPLHLQDSPFLTCMDQYLNSSIADLLLFEDTFSIKLSLVKDFEWAM